MLNLVACLCVRVCADARAMAAPVPNAPPHVAQWKIILLAVVTNPVWTAAVSWYLLPVLDAKGYSVGEKALFVVIGVSTIFPAFVEACDCLVMNARPAALLVWLNIGWGLAVMFAYDAARYKYIDLGARILAAGMTACLWAGSFAVVWYAVLEYCRWAYRDTALRLSRPRI